MINGGCARLQNFCRNVIHPCVFLILRLEIILETSIGFTGLKEN